MGRLHPWFGLDLLGCYCLGCLRVGRRRAFSPLRSIVSFAWAASWSAREWLLALGSSGGVELTANHHACSKSLQLCTSLTRWQTAAACILLTSSDGDIKRSKYELSKHPKTTVSIICYIHTLLGIRWMKRSSGTRSIGRDEREIQ